MWVTGRVGMEGKTWFQSCVESRYGYERVLCVWISMDALRNFTCVRKASALLNRIFLFNIPRSEFKVDSCYSVLESIKDGVGVSPKFDSRRLHFKTPNVVMVFSNALPDEKKIFKGSMNNLDNSKGISLSTTSVSMKIWVLPIVAGIFTHLLAETDFPSPNLKEFLLS